MKHFDKDVASHTLQILHNEYISALPDILTQNQLTLEQRFT